MLRQCAPIRVANRLRLSYRAIGNGRGDRLGDVPGVHPIQEIAPHQAVAAPSIKVQTGTARHGYFHARLIGVKKAL